MLISRFVVGILSLSLIVPGAGVVSAQDFPNKPIRIVVAGLGGDSDFMMRIIAQGISGPLGQQVIIDNRPVGVVPGQVVSGSPPDGYTLLATGGAFWLAPLMQSTPYDPVADFLPLTLVARGPNILVVHPSVPAKSVKELIVLAKTRPGELNYSSGATGSSSHLSAELFKAMAGVNMVRISFKSGSVRFTALVSGEVQLEFSGPSAMPHVKMGKLRALGVTSAEPSALAPGVPTVAASVVGYESSGKNAMFAPAKTPAAIIKRLNQEIVRVLQQPDVKQKFFETGVEAVGSPPEELAAAVKSDIAKFGKVIKDAGIKAD